MILSEVTPLLNIQKKQYLNKQDYERSERPSE